MTHLSLTLLGSPQVTLDGESVSGFDSDKVRGLLAHLMVENDRPHRREKLAGLLWPDYLDRSARTSLRSAPANLRQVIGDQDSDPPFLLITRQTIQFNQSSDRSLDVSDFLALVSGEASQPADISSIEEAVALYKGAFMEGFSLPDSIPFEDWLLMNREFLLAKVLQALHRLAGYHQERGAYEQVLIIARRQLELDIYQEAAHQKVMWSLAQSGQRNEALAQYERLREVLAAELGVEPIESSQAMYEQLQSGEIPGLPQGTIILRREPRDVGECPYRFSPDGQYLAIRDFEGVIQVLDFQTLLNHDADSSELDGVLIKAFEKKIMGIEYSPDGRQLASGSMTEDTAKIWDSESGEKILTLFGHEGPVYSIIFSPDGKRLVTTSADATARVWEADTGKWLFTLLGHTASVFRVSFSPDGKLIATASYDGIAKLWDAETGLELTTLYGHNSGVADVEFSPDGKLLYTASVDGTNRVFLLDIDELMALARSRLTRGFTEEECQRFLHLDSCPLEP